MLWLALRFPDLPLEALQTDNSSTNLYVVEERHRVYVCNQAAKDVGVQTGMKTSSTHALGRMCILDRSPQSERKLLENIANWAYAFTPYIKLESDDCLLLEISQCLRLFGGAESLCNTICDSLNNKGLTYRIGLAHSESGARLLSYTNNLVCNNDSQAAFMSLIKAMPLGTLKEFADIDEQLNKMGIYSIGEILELPNGEIGKRFGQGFIHWLNQLQGKSTAALYQHRDEVSFNKSISFAYAIDNIQFLNVPAKQLIEELTDFLVQHQLEARQIDWQLYSPQGQVHSFNLALERIHDQKDLLLELTTIRMEQIQLMFDIEKIELRCDQLSPVNKENLSLFEDEGHIQKNVQQDAESFVARMQAHLGEDAVYQLALQPEHLPEQQSAKVLPFQNQKTEPEKQGDLFSPQTIAPRPAWLFKRPQRIRHKNNQLHLSTPGTKPGYLRLVQGPERIEGKWWESNSSEQQAMRDYFIAEHDSHVRYWVYHNWQNDNWYVHGVFA